MNFSQTEKFMAYTKIPQTGLPQAGCIPCKIIAQLYMTFSQTEKFMAYTKIPQTGLPQTGCIPC